MAIEPNPDKATVEFNNLNPQEKADVMQLKKLIKPIVMEVRNYEVTVPAAVTKEYRKLGLFGHVTHSHRASVMVQFSKPIIPPP